MRSLMLFGTTCWMLFSGIYGGVMAQEAEQKGENQRTFIVRAIGQVEKTDSKTRIVLEKRYEPGLLGLDGFSHIFVFWWFDKNDIPQKRAILQVHPRGNRNNPLRGVFATRAPVRPNLIALTLCRVVAVHENVVEIDQIDAEPGTPVLDIKPFLPGYDTAQGARVPNWAGPPR